VEQETLTNEVKQQIIAEYIKTAAGRAKLAASMTQPLRTRRDYSSVGRKAFYVEPLPDGALPLYDKDVYTTAYVVGEEGEAIMSVTKGKRVIFPLFEIASLPTVPMTQIKERRFDIIERMLDQAKAEIQKQEDDRIFSVLNTAATATVDPAPLGGIATSNSPILAAAPLDKDKLADLFAQIERHDLHVSRIFMNATDFTDFRKFGRDLYDPETQQTVLNTGLKGSIWGAQIIVTRTVPAGKVFVLTDPEFVGRMPVRIELTVLSADDPKTRTIGFSAFENIGIGAHNPLGIGLMQLSR
jgi:HK97 family phage major capsid protein